MQRRSEADPRTPVPAAWPTPDEIDRHVKRGRRLRAEAMAAWVRAALEWLRAGRPAARPAALVSINRDQTSLRSPLAAIRSSAEILRDHPEMSPAQRALSRSCSSRSNGSSA